MGKKGIWDTERPDRMTDDARKRRDRDGSGQPRQDAGPPPPPPPVPNPDNPILPEQMRDETFKKLLGSLFGYMSPEDQASVGALYGLNPTKTDIPYEITGELRSEYLNSARAASALDAMTATGIDQTNPAFVFLTKAINILKTFGAEGGMRRENFKQFSTQINALFEGAKANQDLAWYIPLAQMFLNPNFSAGDLIPYRNKNGEIIFGLPNRDLFT